MRPRGWAAPIRRLEILLFGPEPVGAFTAASVDAGSTRELTGRTMRGIRFGENATPAKRYYGDLGPLQHFRGAGLTPGESTTLRGAGDGRALPSTKPSANMTVASLEAAYGPWGSSR
jgi:hypothetical protein